MSLSVDDSKSVGDLLDCRIAGYRVEKGKYILNEEWGWWWMREYFSPWIHFIRSLYYYRRHKSMLQLFDAIQNEMETNISFLLILYSILFFLLC